MRYAVIVIAIAMTLVSGSNVEAGGRDLCVPLAPEASSGPISTAAEGNFDEAPQRAMATFEEEVVVLVNQERWNAGALPPLKYNPMLETAAEGHSSNMAVRDFFMHCDPDTLSSVASRIADAGYTGASWAAENIAAWFQTPSAVMAAWMASGGHQANILSTSSREIGVGHVYQSGDQGNVRENPPTGQCPATSFNNGPYLHYWTQNFGRRSSVYPVVINREAVVTTTRDVDLYVYGSFAEMRFRNEGGVWSSWMPFANDTTWQLSPGDGSKTVSAEMRTGSTVASASDSIVLEDASMTIFADGFESGDTSAWSDVAP